MIDKIGGAILAVLDSWVAGATLADNIENVIRAFVKVHPKGNGVIGDMLVADAIKIEASYAALQNNQPAILGALDVNGRKLGLFAIYDDAPLAAQLLGTGGPAGNVPSGSLNTGAAPAEPPPTSEPPPSGAAPV